MSKCYLVIPASGIGMRMQADLPKQYLRLDNGLSVLEQTLDTLLNMQKIQSCVIALAQNDKWFELSPFAKHPKLLALAVGGEQRHHSVMNALEILKPQAKVDDWVLVHDAARPCVKSSDVTRMINQCQQHPVGGILATPVVDTIKQAKQYVIEKTIDRTHLWQAQTPQMYRFGMLLEALEKAIGDAVDITDEASAIEHIGLSSIIIQADKSNIKITHPEDLDLANFYLTHNTSYNEN